MKITRFIPLIVIAAILMGCSFTVNLPNIQTGTTQTYTIDQAYPANAQTPQLSIEMGAGTLNLTGGSNVLVSGAVKTNVSEWQPKVTETSTGVTVAQKQTGQVNIPSNNVINDWALKLGKNPFGLTIAAGAYEGTLDLGGIPLTSLDVSDGASKSTITFGSENPVKMDILSYKTGASTVKITGIGNANVSNVTFDSGAGSYTLDFTGKLQQDINVIIKTGMSEMKLVLPQGVHSVVTMTSGLSNVSASGSWTINGSTYETGSGSPTINISVDMALGSLVLSQK